jgi:hypothetical protein
LLAAVLAVLAAVAVVAPLQAAKASGPESEFSMSISGTDGSAYFTPGHAQVNVTQTWNASSPGNYEAIQVYVSAGSTIYNFDFATGYGSGKRLAVGYQARGRRPRRHHHLLVCRSECPQRLVGR